jgi:chromosome segregation ATPase
MTKQEYYSEVKEKLQKQIWDIELNEAFNRKELETLEHDLGKAETMIYVPGVNLKEGKKALGQMQQERIQREQKAKAFEAKLEDLREQIDFIERFSEAL